MSLLTSFLQLFKWDTSDENDLEQQFDIDKAMNDNWDKLDEAIKGLDTNKVDKEDGKGLSTNDFTNEDKEKLDSLENYDDTAIKQGIEDIQANDAKQDDLIQKLKDNSINVTTEEATSLHITDASTLPAKLDIRGNQRQATREGRNRCTHVIGGLPKTYVSTPTGYVATNVHFDDEFVEKWQENGFTIKVKAKNALSKGAFTRFILDDTWNKRLAYSSFSKRIEDDYNIYESYVSNTDYNLFSDKRFIIMWEDTTEQTGCDLYAIEIDLGNTVGQEMEEYGASPSLDYPSEVEAVGVNVNIFDGEIEEGSYSSSNGEKVTASNTIRNKNFIDVSSFETIIFSNDGIGLAVNIYEYDKDYTFIKSNIGYASNKPFNKSTETKFINFAKGNTNFDKIKIELGEIITSYSPYGQGSVELKKINKNWAKIDTPRTVERGGLSITLDDEDVFTINGTATSNIYINLINITEYQNTTLTNYKLPLKNYKAYFDLISKNNSAVSESNADASLNIRNFGASATGESATTYCVFGSLIKGNTGVQIKDCNITEDRVVAYLYVPSGVKLDNFKFRFALYNENEPDTTYVKHEEQSHILPIQKPMLQGDYFVKESDGWKEVHGWNKEFFANIINNAITSTSNMHITIPNFSNNKALLPSNSEIASIFSNVFKPVAFANIDKVDYGIGIYYASDSLVIRNKDYAALQDYKNSLNNEDFYFYYKLATPTKLPCTEAQSNVLDQLNELGLFAGTNNIITAEGLALLQMRYIADTETYIDNRIDEKLANINQQILNIVGGN